MAHERGGRISPLLDKIRAHPDQSWPMSRMSDIAGLTSRTFQLKFRASTGKKPLAWLTETRVAHAADLLEMTDMPLTDVASGAGFGSGKTFRREFRRLRGTSPSQYRKMFQQP